MIQNLCENGEFNLNPTPFCSYSWAYINTLDLWWSCTMAHCEWDWELLPAWPWSSRLTLARARNSRSPSFSSQITTKPCTHSTSATWVMFLPRYGHKLPLAPNCFNYSDMNFINSCSLNFEYMEVHFNNFKVYASCSICSDLAIFKCSCCYYCSNTWTP